MKETIDRVMLKMQNHLVDLPQEECWVIYLSPQMTCLGKQCIAKGSLTAVNIHPRDVFRYAVAYNAYAILVIHNHPSGQYWPSTADRELARQLVLCGTIMQMPLQDFVIIARMGTYSFFNQKVLPKMTRKTILELWTLATNL
ncbi:JAB domain-containing protein [Weissella diestrammenae]|uniref:JAB domain-containing protein n=1 Tax=Weissella diestrammenae TaxID=1162633 RepID=A0A7G9T649_9LACO|nr:JAB domain-containing protein [Weissella diestrammenae]MCM0582413.1 JAB domain-containing protein [Weissella diestrammenae]QNN75574.1 JAB domain-containing protein [Weissella diestrammenae]